MFAITTPVICDLLISFKGMKISHEWLKEYVGPKLPAPAVVAALLTAHAFEIDGIEEVAGDTIITVDVLPNRSSDCLCHRGIARELASILGSTLEKDPLAITPAFLSLDTVSVTIEDAVACPRFTAAHITGVTVGPSPAWLQARLASIGQRSINNLVDATNYVMFAIGQPLHVYDADLFTRQHGVWKFVVRRARVGETISLLAEAGKTTDRIVTMEGDELLIVDGSTDIPIGLAGVKGGRYAGVHEGTRNIIVEAAHFNPTVVRRTARRLGIIIDASKRFENEPAQALPAYAQAEICTLITAIAGGECVGVVEKQAQVMPPVEPTIVRVARVNQILGLELEDGLVESILLRIGANVITSETSGILLVTSPFERTDLHTEVDYIEEVGRLYGLDHIKAIPPVISEGAVVDPMHFYSELVRTHLIAQGFSEVITSSFRAKDSIQLRNALASDKSYVRSALTENILAVLTQNYPQADLLGIDRVCVFEIGTVFQKTTVGIQEYISLAVGVRSKGNGPTPKDNEIISMVWDELKSALEVTSPILHSIQDGVIEINFSLLVECLPVPKAYISPPIRTIASYRPVSNFPAVARDIALWVPSTITSGEVADTLVTAAGPLCVRQTLFDTFTKNEQTSYAFRLIFLAPDRTLTDVEVNSIMDEVYKTAQHSGYTVR